jgi:hypothetical protein
VHTLIEIIAFPVLSMRQVTFLPSY